MLPPEIVGNKAKGRISKRVFQENKARQIFRKNEHFLPPPLNLLKFYKYCEYLLAYIAPVSKEISKNFKENLRLRGVSKIFAGRLFYQMIENFNDHFLLIPVCF